MNITVRPVVATIALACFGLAALPASAGVSGDITAFAKLVRGMTYAEFAAHQGAKLNDGEYKAIGPFGPSLSRCLVVYLPSLANLMGDASSPPMNAGMQCDGPRLKMTQAQLIAMAIRLIDPVLPGYTRKAYPVNKNSGRSSVVWKNASGGSLDFIAYGAKDWKQVKYAHVGFDIEMDVDNPTPAPTPTE